MLVLVISGCAPGLSSGQDLLKACPQGPGATELLGTSEIPPRYMAGDFLLTLVVDSGAGAGRKEVGSLHLAATERDSLALIGQSAIKGSAFPGLTFVTTPSSPGGAFTVGLKDSPTISLGTLFETNGVLLIPRGASGAGFWGEVFALWLDHKRPRVAKGVFCAQRR